MKGLSKKEKRITKGVRVSFYLPGEWYEKLQDIANKNGMTITVILRTAVKEYLEKENEKKS